MSIRYSQEQEQDKALATTEEGGRNTAPFLPIIGVVCLVVVLAFVFWPRSEPAQATVPTIVPTVAIPTAVPTTIPTAEPSFADITTYKSLIESHIEKGQYQSAITTAEGALDIPDINEADRKVLIGYIVSASLKDIESQEFRPTDRQQHQQLVDTYLSLRERAKLSGIGIESPLQVARKAQASSQFPLAKVAIEEALEEGLFNPEIDRDITRLYVSTLYGLGEWYTQTDKDSPLYEEGLRALVTSDAVADHYRTGQSEAEELLRQLGSTDEVTPLDTPLLP